MFIGHHAVGFALKRFAPRTSLGVLMAAPLLLDFIWPALILLGVERAHIEPQASPFLRLGLDDFPYSHSLLFSLVYAVLSGSGYLALTRYRPGALAIGVGVLSHWVLDFVAHVPDMPLYPGSLEVGLGLWRSTAGTIVVEAALFVAGVAVYARCTRARDRTGKIAFWAFVALLVFVYAGNVLGPPPPSVTAIGVVGLSSALFLIWVFWFDRHREPT